MKTHFLLLRCYSSCVYTPGGDQIVDLNQQLYKVTLQLHTNIQKRSIIQVKCYLQILIMNIHVENT